MRSILVLQLLWEQASLLTLAFIYIHQIFWFSFHRLHREEESGSDRSWSKLIFILISRQMLSFILSFIVFWTNMNCWYTTKEYFLGSKVKQTSCVNKISLGLHDSEVGWDGFPASLTSKNKWVGDHDKSGMEWVDLLDKLARGKSLTARSNSSQLTTDFLLSVTTDFLLRSMRLPSRV